MAEDGLTLTAFEAHVTATNNLDPNDTETPLLGLVGEVGSLVSALKKKRRDADAYFGYHQAVVEELGDVLWYLTAVAKIGGTTLSETAARMLTRATDSEIYFGDLIDGPDGIGEKAFESSLLKLAGEAGDLAKRSADGTHRNNVAALQGDLIKLLRALIQAAKAVDVSLTDAARYNIEKTEDRWPTNKVFPPPRDEGRHIDEQLPRKLRVLIYERDVNKTKFVFQKSGGILLGDRLTDNHHPEDDYRFHDVFHLAHATVLAWSPTTRALLKIKRKSDKALDENQDGARASLIEEGLTTWIFEIAKQHKFFANTPRLGFDLLKDVKQFVKGYEAETLPMWLWESAILQGYAVFREFQAKRSGVVVTDMATRKIWFEDMTADERVLCGISP